MKKLVAVLLFLTVCLSVSGCTIKEEPVMSFGNSVITEQEFQYYLAYYKGVFLDSFTDMKDTPAYYRTILENGQTMEEFLFKTVMDNVSMTLVSMELFDQRGLVIADTMKNEVSSYIDSLITDYAGGDKKSLNAELSNYGINLKMLENIYLDQEKSGFLFDYLYGDNGIITVSDDERQAYLEENYCRIQHIYINNAYEYVLTEKGYLQYDKDGNVLTSPLPKDVQTEKDDLIALLEAALEAGEDYNTLYKDFSEDHLYENGYYLTKRIDFVKEVVNAAFLLEVGEYTKVESDVGTHFILRLPLDEKPWENESNADFFDTFEDTLRTQLFTKYVQSYIPEIQYETEKLHTYSVEKSPVNYRF